MRHIGPIDIMTFFDKAKEMTDALGGVGGAGLNASVTTMLILKINELVDFCNEAAEKLDDIILRTDHDSDAVIQKINETVGEENIKKFKEITPTQD